MFVQDLTINQLAAALSEAGAEDQQGRFRRIDGAAEHRLAAKQRTLRDPVHAADQPIVVPHFYRMRIPQFVQPVIGGNDFRGDPGPLCAVVGTAFDHLTKGVIERHAIRGMSMKAFHAATEMKMRRPQDGARIGRPP
ncbi:hypothetical protein D3C75_1035620 [compost metagenome]